MARPRWRIDQEIVVLLEEAEVDYQLKPGKKHIKLMIDGKMIAVLPYTRRISSSNIETRQNVVSAIRRHLRGVGKCQ